MPLFALSPETSDALAVWGLVVGVLGLLVGLVGFGYTIYQVRKVKAAAEAAEEAAKKTLADNRTSYWKFAGAFGSVLLSELQTAANAKDWKLAEVRARDLAWLLGKLGRATAVMDRLSRDLRDFGQKFARRAAGENPKFSEQKWAQLLNDLHARLDELNTPFSETADGSVGANPPGRTLPGDREEPPGEDESRRGELGEGRAAGTDPG